MKLKIRNTLRKVSQALYEGSAAKGIRDHQRDAADKLSESSRLWLENSTLQGIGVGTKSTNNIDTKVPCIQVYVDKKKPIEQLQQPAPSVIRFGQDNSIPIDVIEIGELKLQMAQYAYKQRPLHSGLSIASISRYPGTLGLIVTKNHSSASRYILSNYHVIKPLSSQDNGQIWQQAKHDGGNSNDTVAQFEQGIPLVFGPYGLPNQVDAAIARLKKGVSFSLAIPGVGPIKGVTGVVREGCYIQIIGRTSGHSKGKVLSADFQTRLSYPGPNGEKLTAGFKNLVLCDRYSEPGDSGAIVINSAKYAVGLHMAGSSKASVFCRIKPIFDQLDIALIQE